MSRAYLTAIKRNKLSAPTQWLLDNDMLGRHILDYGCGKGGDVAELDKLGNAVVGYDPHYYPHTEILAAIFEFDTIICNYVLNVVDQSERIKVLNKLLSLHAKNIYVTVRRDLEKDYVKTKRGTEQWQVYLDYPVVKETAGYCIYKIK